MLSRRRLTIAVLLVAVVAFLGVVYLEIQTTATFTTYAYKITRPVGAGQALNTSNLSPVTLKTDGQQFNFVSNVPAGAVAAVPLVAGTLLQAGDLVSSQNGQVQITLQHTPGLQVGQMIDIYLNQAADTSNGNSSSSGVPSPGGTTPPSSVSLIGVGILVTAVNGNSVTIEVPFSELTDWATISAFQPSLVAVTADTTKAPSATGNNLVNALTNLEKAASKNGG